MYYLMLKHTHHMLTIHKYRDQICHMANLMVRHKSPQNILNYINGPRAFKWNIFQHPVLRVKFQKWFHDRRKEASENNMTMSPAAEEVLLNLLHDSAGMIVSYLLLSN
ncbi:unnamed protein product [Cuscuta europaea]|uniref:Uncharacterized protein n=1 Tax=Cuscuta europaea TaxID=41803 RepID=A0A9P0ZTB1_CUSEU|nr:unnamed protein product [Cuscuta europaea]